MTDREAMQRALEALDRVMSHGSAVQEAKDILRERLAQPEQEPICAHGVGKTKCDFCKPLTDDRVWLEYMQLWPFRPNDEPALAKDILRFARAIEAAHGIKGEA